MEHEAKSTDLKTCLACDAQFSPRKGEFYCPTGEPHRLAPKTYYMDDAPTDPGPFENGVATGDNRRHSRCIVSNLVPEKHYIQGTERKHVPGRDVIFIRGTYTTEDAEEQYWLDRKPGLCTKARWEEVYLTDHQKIELQRMEIAAARNRLEIERNELLAMAKNQNSGSKQAAGKGA